MSNPWKDKKVNCIGRFNIHSIGARKEDPVKWYLEVYEMTRIGSVYRGSYGSKLPLRLLAVWRAYLSYKQEDTRPNYLNRRAENITLVILIIVLVALAGVYLWLS